MREIIYQTDLYEVAHVEFNGRHYIEGGGLLSGIRSEWTYNYEDALTDFRNSLISFRDAVFNIMEDMDL